MKIAVAKETAPGETRVALIPDTVRQLTGKGHEVAVAAGAGSAAFFSDEAYTAAGASIAASTDALYKEADIAVRVQKPSPEELAELREGSALVSFLNPYGSRDLLQRLAERRITALAMEMIPRISRAQNMDALSSMATVAGYRAVLMAAEIFPRFFPMFMTAAGTIAPARVFVLGAGVAGLQAIATAKRLGGVVEAFDTRPVVKEQVESLGARFVSLELDAQDTQDAGGYAKELSEEQHRKEMELLATHVAKSDVVITTAQIPGRPAPRLIPEDSVQAMKAGSVIVDLAAEGGGNCECTEAGKTVVKHGVTVMGPVNLPASMPIHASQMYSRNVANLLLHLAGESGLNLDLEDPITGGTVVTHGGAIVHPALQAE